MRTALVSLVLVFAFAALGQESVSIDLAVSNPGSTRFFSVTADKEFSVKLTNVVPGKTYQIVEEDNRTVTAAALKQNPSGCGAEDLLAVILKDKNSETDVAKALNDATPTASCTKAQVDAAKALRPTVTMGSYPAGKVLHRTIKRESTEWKVVVTPQGTTQAPTATPTQDFLDKQREVVDKHSSLIVMKCSYSAEKCASDALYVNSDQVSTIYITDVPKGKKLTVRVGGRRVLSVRGRVVQLRDVYLIARHDHRAGTPQAGCASNVRYGDGAAASRG